jgi:hypothetical protein
MLQGIVIDENALFDDTALFCAFGFSEAALAKARREKKLRFTRQGRRVYYLGAWVTAWLRAAGEDQGADQLRAGGREAPCAS